MATGSFGAPITKARKERRTLTNKAPILNLFQLTTAAHHPILEFQRISTYCYPEE
jgi:hypothetical protein